MFKLLFTILAILYYSATYAGPVVNWGGGGVAEIYAQNGLEFFDDTRIITGATDPTSVSFDAPNGSIYISTSTNLTYQKQDDGDTTNWNPLYFVPLFTDDNRLVRTDGIDNVQQSGISISDTDELSGALSISTDSATVTGLTEDALAVPDATGLLESTGVLINATDDVSGIGSIGATSAQISGLTEDAVIVPTADGTFESSGVLVNATDQVSGVTQLDVDDVRVDGFTVSTTATNQSLELSPNGTGSVDVTYLDDSGSAVFTGTNGALSADFPDYRYSTLDGLLYVPGLQSDNIQINGNAISTTNTDGNLVLDPDGTGEVRVDGFTGNFLLESSATGGITESTSTVSDIEGKLDKFPSETNDNRVARTDTDGNALQGSGIIIDDLDAVSGLTELDVDNVNINGNTVSSTTGDLALNPTGSLTSSEVDAEEVVFADGSAGITGSSNFRYLLAQNNLIAGGISLDDSILTSETTDTNIEIIGNGIGAVDVDNLRVKDSAITGLDATEDLVITAESTRHVEIEDIIIDGNEITSETASPLLITPESTQPVNIDDVDIKDNTISASETDEPLDLSGNGDGRVRIDRGGTLYEAGSRNPEYVQLVNDPSFQAGVAEWSCTDATVAQVTNTDPDQLDHGVDSSQTAAKISVTADGGYCEIVKTIGTSQAQSYVPSIYYASTSADAFIDLARDSRGRVVEPDFLNTGEYQFASTELIASTGLSIRLGGNTGDEIWTDLGSMELGGYTRNASKNCSGVLDCENTYSAKVSNTGVVTLEDFDFIDGDCATPSAGTKVCDFNSSVFSVAPKCWASVTTSTTNTTSANPVTTTENSVTFYVAGTTGSFSGDFNLFCRKNKPDYKTTEDQGVTIIGSKTAFDTSENILSGIVSASGDLTDLTFSNLDIGKKYLVSGVMDLAASLEDQPQVLYRGGSSGTGTIHGQTEYREAYSTTTRAAYGVSFMFTADSENLYANFNGAGLVQGDGTKAGVFLQITEIPSEQTWVVENSGTTVYQGERGTLTAGYASFGGATDGSVCSSGTCGKYREVGDLADSMSLEHAGVAGNYDLTITGLRPNSFLDCKCVGHTSSSDGGGRYCNANPFDFGVNASGQAVVSLATTQATSTANMYIQVKCEGLSP